MAATSSSAAEKRLGRSGWLSGRGEPPRGPNDPTSPANQKTSEDERFQAKIPCVNKIGFFLKILRLGVPSSRDCAHPRCRTKFRLKRTIRSEPRGKPKNSDQARRGDLYDHAVLCKSHRSARNIGGDRSCSSLNEGAPRSSQ